MTRRQSRAAPTVPPVPRPQKRAAPATRESHKAKRSKSAARATVSNTDSRPPASEHPSQLVTVPIAGNDAAPAPVDIAAIVSEAVLGGLQAAGILPQAQKEPDGSNATPAAAVQGSVAAVIQDITGERPPPTNPSTISTSPLSINSIAQSNDRPQLIHEQIAVPLASRVSDKIQSKIWANEYIDLGTLLQIASPNQSQYNFVVQTQHSSDRPVISLEPAQKPKRIANIDQWISAFQTFVAIYTVRSPTDAPALMKYSETVRDLAAKNAHWRYYDENFRFLRQKTLFPWDQIHWELWLQAHHMQKSPTVVSSDSRNRPTRSPFPSGYCWRFHRGEKCSGCNFKHDCFRCGSHHPANQCHFPKQQANSTKAVLRPKSTAVTANNSAPTSRTVSSIGNANQNR